MARREQFTVGNLIVERFQDKFGNEVGSNAIYVDVAGNNDNPGSLAAPVATLTKAFTLVSTTRKLVIMGAGDYEETAAVVWPSVNGVEVRCPAGRAVITAEDSITQVVGADPALATGTWSMTMENIEIDAADSQIGLKVNNTNVGMRINIYLINCPFSQETSTDASINIARAGADTKAIRLYADGTGTLIEGLVTVVFENTDDRIRFRGYRLVGGLTQTGAYAGEITFLQCTMLASGLSTDGAARLTNIGCVYETDANPNVYTQFADAYSA